MRFLPPRLVLLLFLERGGHGFAIRDAKGPVTRWPDLCADWMKEIGVLH